MHYLYLIAACLLTSSALIIAISFLYFEISGKKLKKLRQDWLQSENAQSAQQVTSLTSRYFDKLQHKAPAEMYGFVLN